MKYSQFLMSPGLVLANSMVQAEADGQGQQVKAVWVSAMFNNCSEGEG